MIHTIGDSHAKLPWESIPNVKVHHLGPVLAYSVGRDGLDRVNISNIKLKPNDYIVFSFGEIDCRSHIHKHIYNTSYKKQIDYIIENYFNTIDLNKKLLNFNVNICINNIPPVFPHVRNGSIIKHPNSKYPYLGTDEERKTYVEYFNEILKKYCLLKNYIFIDIYEQYQDETGFLNSKLSDGSVHIKNPKYIKKFIEMRL